MLQSYSMYTTFYSKDDTFPGQRCYSETVGGRHIPHSLIALKTAKNKRTFLSPEILAILLAHPW